MSGTATPVTVTFNYLMPYAAGIVAGRRTGVGSRAYAWLQVRNPSTGFTSRREFGLIDSGCDDCMLDSALLAGLGCAVIPSQVTVAGGGSVSVGVVQGAEIEIEGILVKGRPLTFGSATPSIIGRDVYLRAFELAFRGGDWLHA